MICTHGFPSPASCIDCMDDEGLGAAPTPPEHVDYGMARSHRQLDCPACGCAWPEGRRIWHTTRDRWVCHPCGTDLGIGAARQVRTLA